MLKNTNAKAVLDKQVYYTEEFREKVSAVFSLGKSIKQIFNEAGFNFIKKTNVINDLKKLRKSNASEQEITKKETEFKIANTTVGEVINRKKKLMLRLLM